LSLLLESLLLLILCCCLLTLQGLPESTSLLKPDITPDHCPPKCRHIHPICLGYLVVAYKYALYCRGLQLLPALQRYTTVDQTLKDPKMRNIMLLAYEDLALPSTLCRLMFCKNTAVLHASTQRNMGSPWSCNMALAAPIMLRFLRSATPFH
jgi:hypothetical protein